MVANNSTVSNSISRSHCVPWIAVLAIECLAIVVLNGFATIIFATRRELRNQRTFLPIRNLAIADLLAGGISGALQIERAGGEYCKMWMYDQSNTPLNNVKFAFVHLFSMASLANLAAISLERMYATMRPFQHLTIGKRVYVAIIVAVWITAVTREIAQLVFHEVQATVDSSEAILLNLILYVPYYFISLFIVCISYIIIFINVRWRVRPNPANNSVYRRERKLTITLFIVTLVSLLTLSPAIIFLTVDAIHNGIFANFPFIPVFHLRMVALFFFLANSIANPIIYSLRMQSFREGFKEIFGRTQGQQSTITFFLRSLSRRT